MARRGFFAHILHQAKVEARNRERAQRAAVRAHSAAVQRAERAARAAHRAVAQFARASAAERKRLEKEAREAHVEAMEADVEEQNLKLEETYAALDSILAATLDVDDYVDLESLRAVASHPPFGRSDLEQPIPAPVSPADPPKPIFVGPAPPTGLGALFGKGKHAAALDRARGEYEEAVRRWRAAMDDLATRRRAATEAHVAAEAVRAASLADAQADYARACEAREAEAAERNRELDSLIANLGYGVPEAVQEYVLMVLSNSVYPEQFAVAHEFEYKPTLAELKLKAIVPGPADIPEIKAYKYTKSTDEISAVPQSQKASRDRYASAVHQVALRTIHEVFESDRRALIKTVSLEVGTETIDPATGNQAYIPFVAVGAERDAFLKLNLSAVVPALTLERMGAALSKNPHALVPADVSGVRRS